MSTTSWHNEYLSALANRNKTEHQNKDVYEAYTALASRKSQPSSTQSHIKDEPATSPAPPSSPSNRVLPWSRSDARSPTPVPALILGAHWQEELSEAQRRRGELESELRTAKTEVERERTQARVMERRATELATENAGLTVKLRDRVEELEAKAKLVQVCLFLAMDGESGLMILFRMCMMSMWRWSCS